MYKYDYWLPYASAQMLLPKRVWSDCLWLLISRWIVLALDHEMAYASVKLQVIFSVKQKVGQIARDGLLQGQRLINAHRSFDVLQNVGSPLPFAALFKIFRVLGPQPFCQCISSALLGVKNPVYLPPDASMLIEALGHPSLLCF